jgi:hypothetical protein
VADRVINGDDAQRLDLSLGNEHSIEGISMGHRQRRGVIDGDRQHGHASSDQNIRQVGRKLEFAVGSLDAELPRRHHRDVHLVRLVDHRDRFRSECRIIPDPPQCRMAVQEQIHGSSSDTVKSSTISRSGPTRSSTTMT